MIRRLFRFSRRRRVDIHTDVDDELGFHLQARTDDLMARGLTADAARETARREFGDLADARAYMRRLEWATERRQGRREYMRDFQQDVRYALRRLRAAPSFTVTAILTLALGIGANAAVFSIVNGVLFRDLPFPDPSRLYAVYSANRTSGTLRAPVSAVDLDDWRASRRAIEDLGGYFYAEGSSGVDLTNRGKPRRLSTVFVTPGFFSTLGVAPLEGRLPRDEEMTRGGPDKVVMLSNGFWTREFGGTPDAATTTSLTLEGEPYRVLGVLPPDFRFPTDQADVFVPFATIPDSAIPRIRPVRILNVIARTRPGVAESVARDEMNGIARTLAAQYPEDRSWDSATIVPLHEVVTGQVRGSLLVLLGAVGFVLLIVCANLASLQLARSLGRRREIGVRLALGARRGRLVRQLLTESLVLATIGGVTGVAVANGLVQGLLILGANQLPRAAEVGLDAAALGFAAALTALTALLFGLAPALRLAASDVHGMLRQGTRTTDGPDRHRMRIGLVISEVALVMMLVVGAGLMVRSFAALSRVDAGFDPDRLVAVQFTIDSDRHSADTPPGGGAAYTLVYSQFIEKARALPGIVSAAAVKDPPLRGNGERNSVRRPDVALPAGQDPPVVTAIHVSDGYFATIGARMIDGREYTPRDRADAPLVLVVNEAFARQLFPDTRAVGRHVLLGRDVPAEIIGVVNDIRQVAMAQPAQPTMYLHNLQNSRVKTTIVARTSADPAGTIAAIRDAVWSIDPNQAITTTFTFDESVGRALARPRLLLVLLGGFGVIGLGLGAVGLYGLLAFLVHERRREIGVRLSLGAPPGAVLTMILRRGLFVAGAGIAIGLTGAVMLGRWLTAVLYGVEPYDPATLAAVAIALLATAALASWFPARRAARLDPVEVLRAD